MPIQPPVVAHTISAVAQRRGDRLDGGLHLYNGIE